MNYGIILKIQGNLLIFEAIGMVPGLLLSLYYGQQDKTAFIISILVTGICGYVLSRTAVSDNKFKAKEAITIVSLGWISASFFGCLPFIFSGSIPSFIDAFFETVSGFTTTGATIIDDVEILPKGLLFWRSFTHWIGGMGILVFTLAVVPAMGVGSFQIFKAESPGPIANKIVPRIKDTAKILYTTYMGITLLEIILLKLGGMSLYQAAVHTFGTVGTGGFSTKNASIRGFDSAYIHVVISIFMLLSGVNFSLYFALYKKKWRDILDNEELKFYLGIVLISVILIAVDINTNIYHDVAKSIKDALFQVSSVITTTGYSTVDYDKWSAFSKGILFILMFVGGCAGSTSGGIKSIRVLVLLKLVKKEISRVFHPRAVIPVKIGPRSISSNTLSSIASFFVLYIIVFLIGTLIISLEGIGLIDASSAVAATLGNIGPGFGFAGPARTYSQFSPYSKLLLSFFMLLGRLELFTLIVFFTPKFWREEV
ncbi:MAG: TrkH family potassium uptake protein [Clostridia bacterium]|nr:TrkH family potassium uptake protein [Clostridia bacterium]